MTIDFKTIEGDFSRPDVVKAGSANESNENTLSDSYKQSADINGKFSKEYEDNAINAQWEKEKKQEAKSDTPAQYNTIVGAEPSMPFLPGQRTCDAFKVGPRPHNHGPDLTWTQVVDLKARILERCRLEVTEPRINFDEECSRQCERRKARSVGLTHAINTNPAIKRAVKLCMTLPLLPPDRTANGFQAIKTYCREQGVMADVDIFMAYVERTWILGVGAPHLSVFGQVRRTNNDQESFHKFLLMKMSHAHPNVCHFNGRENAPAEAQPLVDNAHVDEQRRAGSQVEGLPFVEEPETMAQQRDRLCALPIGDEGNDLVCITCLVNRRLSPCAHFLLCSPCVRIHRQALKVCIYLMSDVALHMELEDGVNTSVKELVQAIVSEDQLGLPRSAANIFTLWMCSGLLELRLKPHHQPFAVRAKWPDLLAKYAHATESRQRRDEPVLSFQRNVFVPRSVDEKVKEPRLQDLLYCEARYNILEGRYPCEQSHYIMLGGIQARLELGPYNPHVHTIQFFREQHSRFLPAHMRRGAWRSWLGLSGKHSPEVRLLEHYKRIPPSTPDRKLQRKYLEFCWALPYYGCAFFQGQVEQPVRGLTSLITHQDIPVLVGINPQGVYIIDNIQCILLLGLKFEEMSWDFAKPSQEDNPDCLPCIFIQFRVVENGMRVSKILQVFSKQAVMMDALISGFVEDIKKKMTPTTKPTGDETDRPDTATDSDETQMPLTTVTGARREAYLGNKLSKLTLATFDDEGHCIGQMGSWSFSY